MSYLLRLPWERQVTRIVCYDIFVWLCCAASSCPPNPDGHLATARAGQQVDELIPRMKWSKSIPATRKTQPLCPTASRPMWLYLYMKDSVSYTNFMYVLETVFWNSNRFFSVTLCAYDITLGTGSWGILHPLPYERVMAECGEQWSQFLTSEVPKTRPGIR